MVTISSVDLQRQFGEIREKALREPVTITHHGRESLVLMSAEEFKRLKGLDREVYHVLELPAEWREALEKAEPAAECPDT